MRFNPFLFEKKRDIFALTLLVIALGAANVYADDGDLTRKTDGIDEVQEKAQQPQQSIVQDSQEAKSEPNALQDETHNILDRQRVFVTNQFVDLTSLLDRIISRKNGSENNANKSYLVLNLESTFNEGGDHEYGARLKGKADLPNTKQRFKLIFESEPEEDASLQENELGGQVPDNDVEPERAIAGIEYSKKTREFEWRPSIDVGARLTLPLDYFARIKVYKKTQLPMGWVNRSRLDLPYFSESGAKPSFRLTFSKGLTENLSFTSVSRYKYTRQERLSEALQSFQLNQLLSESFAMEYKVGAFGDNEPTNDVDGYFGQVALKHGVYKDWMFLTWVPQVNYLEEDDWKPSYGFTLKLQAIYSDES